MTRGKYAVKAAQNRADHLKQDLEAERRQHAADVATLKATVERLSAQLTGAVDDLAAERVRQVQAECADQIRAVREQHRTDSLEAFRRLARAVDYEPAINAWHIPEGRVPELVMELAEVLHIPAGEAQQVGAADAGHVTPRQTRRANADRMRGQLNGTPYMVVKGK